MSADVILLVYAYARDEKGLAVFAPIVAVWTPADRCLDTAALMATVTVAGASIRVCDPASEAFWSAELTVGERIALARRLGDEQTERLERSRAEAAK